MYKWAVKSPIHFQVLDFSAFVTWPQYNQNTEQFVLLAVTWERKGSPPLKTELVGMSSGTTGHICQHNPALNT